MVLRRVTNVLRLSAVSLITGSRTSTIEQVEHAKDRDLVAVDCAGHELSVVADAPLLVAHALRCQIRQGDEDRKRQLEPHVLDRVAQVVVRIDRLGPGLVAAERQDTRGLNEAPVARQDGRWQIR